MREYEVDDGGCAKASENDGEDRGYNIITPGEDERQQQQATATGRGVGNFNNNSNHANRQHKPPVAVPMEALSQGPNSNDSTSVVQLKANLQEQNQKQRQHPMSQATVGNMHQLTQGQVQTRMLQLTQVQQQNNNCVQSLQQEVMKKHQLLQQVTQQKV